MRVLAINFGDKTCASSYYRVWQYQQPLRALGVELDPVAARDFSGLGNLPQYDVVLVQKRLFSSGKVRAIRRRSKRLIYDLDDALWAPQARKHSIMTRLRTLHRLKAICRVADLCLAANDVLAQKMAGWGARTTVLPMVLDERNWTVRPRIPGARIRVGWSGGPANLRYLEAIEPALLEAQRKIQPIEFVVHCGKTPAFKSDLRYTHVPFEPGKEPDVVGSFDIGLAPLPDDEFAAGKSPIKCIQYMASGVVPVVSPVGATRSMFVDGRTGVMARTIDEWARGIIALASDPKARDTIAANARAEFEASYALGPQASVFAQAMRSPE